MFKGYTVNSIELKEAVARKYKVTKVHLVHHWSKWVQHNNPGSCADFKPLFESYVDTNYAIKLKAAGYPEYVKTTEDKRVFCQKIKDVEGININPDDIIKNPGLKSQGKAGCNCFWGKLGQRSNRSKTTIISNIKSFYMGIS